MPKIFGLHPAENQEKSLLFVFGQGVESRFITHCPPESHKFAGQSVASRGSKLAPS
jgi:hypothetical protein